MDMLAMPLEMLAMPLELLAMPLAIGYAIRDADYATGHWL